MADRIFEIGGAALDVTDQMARKLIDNVVHAEVAGYRKAEVITNSFPFELDKAMNKKSPMKPQVEDSFYPDISGTLSKTGGKLDVALGCEGFFVISGPWGEGYTRDGRFKLDKDGRLLTVAGNFPVMGQGGPIIIVPGTEVEFTQSGEIKAGGIVVDSLQILNAKNIKSLDSINGAVFRKKSMNDVMLNVENPRILSGYFETSNISVIDETMKQMMLEKTNNAITEFVRNRSTELGKAIDMGRVN
ncbi:MAG: hypothetical protein WCV91_03730 [Candidatus Margulisiibacteriota bacterium]